MATRDKRPPLWKQIVQQSLLGRRGVGKTGTLWLPIAVVLSSQPEIASEDTWLGCMLLFVASAFRTQALILANDLTDQSEDRLTGKDRWIWRLSPVAGIAVVVFLLASGVAIFLVTHMLAALTAYAGAAVLGLLYSLRTARFKERGLAGLIVYSAACALAYVVVPWAWFDSTWLVGGLPLAAVFLDRWVNLHFHQIIDYESDLAGRNETYAVRSGLDRARHTLQWAAGLASVALLAVLIWLAVHRTSLQPVAGVGLAAAVAAGLHARAEARRGRGSLLIREVAWHYLGLTFALFRLLPPVLFARLALFDPMLWIPAGATAVTSLLEARLSLRYRYE
jgi:1,4-dihydroxy-2-naphthoate octaprenyltransferase